MTYPVAETFYSIQGEGVWTGTPMFFVRLAGCNVGKYAEVGAHGDISSNLISPYAVKTAGDFQLLQDKRNAVCTSHQGERFLCDTDYHMTEKLTAAQLVGMTADERSHTMLVTGGEPFLHDLDSLMSMAINEGGMRFHIETSGTKPISLMQTVSRRRTKPPHFSKVWITCCPKEGFLDANYWVVDEWKFLVGPSFNPESVHSFLKKGDKRPVFIQPINGVNEPDHEATSRCVEIVKQNPTWRLSAQLHKYLRER